MPHRCCMYEPSSKKNNLCCLKSVNLPNASGWRCGHCIIKRLQMSVQPGGAKAMRFSPIVLARNE